MEKVSQTPHDAVFRQMLMHQAVAKDFLQLYLPAPFLAICELDSLQLVSGSFVEEDLRASYSDILYSLRTRHGPGYVYALIEHQSTPDKLMAFRLLRYALAAMQRHLDAEPRHAAAGGADSVLSRQSEPLALGPQLATAIRRSGAGEGAL